MCCYLRAGAGYDDSHHAVHLGQNLVLHLHGLEHSQLVASDHRIPGGDQDLSWTVQPGESNVDANYLIQVVEFAQIDDGLSLPLVDSASLDQARRTINSGVRTVSRLARQALASGDVDAAERLATDALRQDPQNPEANSQDRLNLCRATLPRGGSSQLQGQQRAGRS